MIRSPIKVLGVLLLTVAAFVFAVRSTFAGDIQEFVDIPITGDRQATVEPILACRNGIMFGFHAIDKLAKRTDGPHQWDISFAKDDGNLLLKEYPLWLGQAEVPLVRNGITFPYAGFYTLLWNETVPVAPLSTCYSGAGTGFCNTKLDIEDCEINPGLVAGIAQIGPQDTTRVVTDTLVYEVRAYDPKVGTNNGDGIAQVAMKIIDSGTGAEVYAIDRTTTISPETRVEYCAFFPDCKPWVFSKHTNTWPNGQPVENGTYLLRAIINTPDNTRTVAQTEIEINTPPYIETVHVLAGDFLMGADSDIKIESPAHTVAVADFWIMKTEVTNKQYMQCVKAGVCTAPQGGAHWGDPAYTDHPVTGIDWKQANTFATWVGGRLPTEAEWEKACRGIDGRTYPWGNAAPTYELANYDNVLGDTTPVGSYPGGASPYGALDMGGNVWEWTSSLYQAYPYRADDGREDSAAPGRRVVRGGSYYYTHYQLTCTFRSPLEPDEVNSQIGLRVVFDKPLNPEGVRFVTPADGAVVPPRFDVEMAAEGLTVEPAGEVHEGAGHFHILVDTDFVAPGELIPFDENHLHFGNGQMTTTLELKPGVHTLRLQFANGAHIALAGAQYRDQITVTVKSGY
jgi:formylglycine-generating enzyme required for sulfatase activity